MAAAQKIEFQAQAQVSWRAFRSKEPGYWVAVCDALNLSAQARSWNELFSTCAEVVQELLLDLLKDGELDTFLRSQGWVTLTPIPKRTANVKFDIPIHLAPERSQNAAAH